MWLMAVWGQAGQRRLFVNDAAVAQVVSGAALCLHASQPAH